MEMIDLVNKFANGEDVPEKIKFRDIIYSFEEGHYYDKYDDTLEDTWNLTCKSVLKDKVEIIQDK